MDILRSHLSALGSSGRRFQRLAEAIAAVDDPRCDACQNLLDLYVGDELREDNVQERYPGVHRHLEDCPRCQSIYDLLAETLRAEKDGTEPFVPHLEPPRLSFLRPSAPNSPWRVRLRPRLANTPFRLNVAWNPAFLRSVIQVSQGPAVRNGEVVRPASTFLLLADAVQVGERLVEIEVTGTQHADRPDVLVVEAALVGAEALSPTLWAHLTWERQIRSAPLDRQGRAQLGEVSIAVLQAAPDGQDGLFSIAFEAEDSREWPAPTSLGPSNSEAGP